MSFFVDPLPGTPPFPGNGGRDGHPRLAILLAEAPTKSSEMMIIPPLFIRITHKAGILWSLPLSSIYQISSCSHPILSTLDGRIVILLFDILVSVTLLGYS